MSITAKDIERLLAQRHDSDIFVPQCKNGSTYYTDGLQILDGWAMAKSWKNPKFTGYEIKVSRGDFIRDDKWRKALPLCNEFYWVAPQGVIAPEEVTAECGLIIVSKGGMRLFIKRKAPYREIETPIDLIYYILICRTHIRGERVVPSKAEQWRDWLAMKDEHKEIGYNVSRKIQELFRERVTKVESENRVLRDEIKKFPEVEQTLLRLGLMGVNQSVRGNFLDLPHRWTIESMAKEALDPLPKGLVDTLRECANKLEAAQRRLDLAGSMAGERGGR